MSIERRTWWSRWIVAATIVTTLATTSPAAAKGPIGLGIILGEPSGLTGKYWLDGASAVQTHLAFNFRRDVFVLIADYLFHFDVFNVRSQAIDLPIYVGIGGKLTIDDDDGRDQDDDDDDLGLGVRIPIGLDLLLRRAPLEFFLEIAPGLRFIPGTNGDIDGGVGVRYYF